MILAYCTSSESYLNAKSSGWPTPFATKVDNWALEMLKTGLDGLYDAENRKILNRRRAQVLEILAANRIFGKYENNGRYLRGRGDTAVYLNGRPFGHGLLDVCFWANCCERGEFYDCKSGFQQAEMLEPTVAMLSQLHNSLMLPTREPRTQVGIISYADGKSVAEEVRNCREHSGVSVYGEFGFERDILAFRACNHCTRS